MCLAAGPRVLPIESFTLPVFRSGNLWTAIKSLGTFLGFILALFAYLLFFVGWLLRQCLTV